MLQGFAYRAILACLFTRDAEWCSSTSVMLNQHSSVFVLVHCTLMVCVRTFHIRCSTKKMYGRVFIDKARTTRLIVAMYPAMMVHGRTVFV